MDRGASAQVVAEAGASKNQPIHLFIAELDSGTFRFCDGAANIVWDGNTYFASGQFITFDPIKETSDTRVSQTTFTLSGVDQTLIAAFQQDDYLDRRVRIYKTFLNSSGGVMEPVLLFDGRMDGPTIQENPAPDQGTCTIVIPATSHFGDFERKPGRRTNTNVQQLHYPGDVYFDFTSQIPGQKQSVWGRAKA